MCYLVTFFLDEYTLKPLTPHREAPLFPHKPQMDALTLEIVEGTRAERTIGRIPQTENRLIPRETQKNPAFHISEKPERTDCIT